LLMMGNDKTYIEGVVKICKDLYFVDSAIDIIDKMNAQDKNQALDITKGKLINTRHLIVSNMYKA
jgi:hypothetical protein